MEKLRLFEMFAGYGGASFALKKAGIPFECVGFSEIDKYAIDCYQMNHIPRGFRDGSFNEGDATKIDPHKLQDFDLLTGGFPCQAFSVAGKGLGELDPRGTLFNEIIRVAEVKKPRYMLLENVKGLLSKKNKPTFDKILSELDRIGYAVEYRVLNSKEHGIPQNRERVFFVCYREYLDWKGFRFPGKETPKILLKDILDKDVDEKYYLKYEKTKKLLSNFKMPDISYCIDANYYKGTNLKGYLEKKRRQLVIPCLTPDRINKRQNGRRFKTDGEPMFTINTQDRHGVLLDKSIIRKLTPTECFRLMGFLNDEIYLEGISDTQRYKLAGNGWDINLVSKIFKEMFK